jgi:acyl-CoA synthetase (AMP-forming)/AMP-acid ligase II
MRYDEEFVNIPNVFRIGSRRYGDKVALVDGASRWTYVELEQDMLKAVRAAMALGVEPGDRVGLCAPNSAEWIIAAGGILGAGGVLVPINTRLKGPEIVQILRTSTATALFSTPSFLGSNYIDMIRAVDPELPALNRLVTLPGSDVNGAVSWSDFLRAGSSVTEIDAHHQIDEIRTEDLSDIMFTSGTTGAPKGVMLTNGHALRTYGDFGEIMSLSARDTNLIIPPFFHSFGYKAGWLTSFMFGVKVIPQRMFSCADVLLKIETERVSVMFGPPTVYIDLINDPTRSRYDLSSLRVALPSAASVPSSLHAQLADELGFQVVLSGYGLTEAGACVSSSRIGDDPDDIANSVGRALDGVELMIVDDSGQPLGVDETGEIWVRGYVVMCGYWNDDEATHQVIDENGWLHTGDVGSLNPRGFLKITDRKKDMFIVGGFNAYPAEIESALSRFAPIAHVAVVGTPDARLGEVGVAFVVLKPQQSTTPEQIIAWARDQMANFKVPRRVYIVDDLPRNASMKVRKAELRARLLTAR